MAHGVFVDGVWHTQWYDAAANGGRFVPAEPVFRNWVTPDGSAGPSGEGGFAAERGRYHLYVSLACPYAHRTVIFRKLKELESVISMSILDPVMGEQGWEFGTTPGTIADTVNGTEAVWLNSLQDQGPSVAIDGTALSSDAVANLISNLQKTGFFSNIEIKETYQDDTVKDMQAFQFTLTCSKAKS